MEREVIQAAFEKHKAFENKNEPIDQFVANLLIAIRDVEKELSVLTQQKQDLLVEFDAKMKLINEKIKIVRSKCPHLTYKKDTDPSGGTDRIIICETCFEILAGEVCSHLSKTQYDDKIGGSGTYFLCDQCGIRTYY